LGAVFLAAAFLGAVFFGTAFLAAAFFETAFFAAVFFAAGAALLGAVVRFEAAARLLVEVRRPVAPAVVDLATVAASVPAPPADPLVAGAVAAGWACEDVVSRSRRLPMSRRSRPPSLLRSRAIRVTSPLEPPSQPVMSRRRIGPVVE
jgi:hypothetical protein